MIYQKKFTDQIFYPNFFSFDFDVIFFILSIFLFSDAKFFYQFFSILNAKKIQNFSIFLSQIFVSNFFFSSKNFLSSKFLLEIFSKIGKRQKNF